MSPSAYVTRRELREHSRRLVAWAGLGYVVFVILVVGVGLFFADRAQDAEADAKIAAGVTRSCEVRFLLTDLIARNTATLEQATSGGIDPLSQERTAFLMHSTERARQILLGVPVTALACLEATD